MVLMSLWGCASEPAAVECPPESCEMTNAEKHRVASMATGLQRCSQGPVESFKGPTAYWENCEAIMIEACTSAEGWRLLAAAGVSHDAPCYRDEAMLCTYAGEGCPE